MKLKVTVALRELNWLNNWPLKLEASFSNEYAGAVPSFVRTETKQWWVEPPLYESARGRRRDTRRLNNGFDWKWKMECYSKRISYFHLAAHSLYQRFPARIRALYLIIRQVWWKKIFFSSGPSLVCWVIFNWNVRTPKKATFWMHWGRWKIQTTSEQRSCPATWT